MATIELFENEELVTESDNKQLFVTSTRVRYYEGKRTITSIMLDKVSSMQSNYKDHPWLLLLGLVLFVTGAVSYERQEISFPAMGVGIFLAIIYWISRKHVITIASDGGGRIMFETSGMKRDVIIQLMQRIEEAKFRYREAAKAL